MSSLVYSKGLFKKHEPCHVKGYSIIEFTFLVLPLLLKLLLLLLLSCSVKIIIIRPGTLHHAEQCKALEASPWLVVDLMRYVWE